MKGKERCMINGYHNYCARESRCTCTLTTRLLFAGLSAMCLTRFCLPVPYMARRYERNAIKKNKDTLLELDLI